MKKQEALRILFAAAQQYHEQLENQNLLFLFGSGQAISYFEASFLAQNFLHLTGVRVVQGHVKSAVDFYDHCIDQRLSVNDFELSANGLSEMKLSVLPQLMNIERVAKQVGDYNRAKPLLVSEKLAGNITACMGFVRDGRYYIPNTVLKEDIRDITQIPQQRVLAVFKKAMKATSYHRPCYTGKGITMETLILPPHIAEKIETKEAALLL